MFVSLFVEMTCQYVNCHMHIYNIQSFFGTILSIILILHVLNAMSSTFVETSVEGQLSCCLNKPWTARLDLLQSAIYAEAVKAFGCIQPGSGQKPKKNRREVKIGEVREEIRMLVRRKKSAPHGERYGVDQWVCG